jgi:hypothetical protein
VLQTEGKGPLRDGPRFTIQAGRSERGIEIKSQSARAWRENCAPDDLRPCLRTLWRGSTPVHEALHQRTSDRSSQTAMEPLVR